MELQAVRLEDASFVGINEEFWRRGWSDGLPIVPPTPELVEEFVGASGWSAESVVGDIPERRSTITCGKLAVNAVMAGCLPEYMPALVAAIRAICDPRFKFNHLASLGSPWPLFVFNGPVVKRLGLHSGGYLFGPGHRANSCMARAVSLALQNCALARPDGIQRGQWGTPARWNGCIAEDQETSWSPLHVQHGFDVDQSVVTAFSVYPNLPTQVASNITTPERILDAACHSISGFGGAQWIRGMYVLFISVHHVALFDRHGWDKEAVKNYVFENTRVSVADLKLRGLWGTPREDMDAEMQQIRPGDSERLVYLFRDNGDIEDFLHAPSDVQGRDVGLEVVVAGGNAGHRVALGIPYSASTNPVSKIIGEL